MGSVMSLQSRKHYHFGYDSPVSEGVLAALTGNEDVLRHPRPIIQDPPDEPCVIGASRGLFRASYDYYNSRGNYRVECKVRSHIGTSTICVGSSIFNKSSLVTMEQEARTLPFH